MNSYEQCSDVERRGRITIDAYLKRECDGRVVLLEKGPLARVLQETTGDAIVQRRGVARSVELKCEESDKYGNLFLETFSNRNLENRESFIRFNGSNPGWMFKLVADYLFYYFIDTDDLYAMDYFRLKQWAFGAGDGEPHIFSKYKMKRQNKRSQLNDTWGWCVPIDDLRCALGPRSFKHIHPALLLSSDGATGSLPSIELRAAE